ncbi:MAG: aquaporin [Bifidobacterium sp.]|nr:aquaporin [Bifidobacterium sp.]
MSAVETTTPASAKPAHSLWARIGAEFAGSLLICFAIYLMCTFGSAFYNVNLAFIALGTGCVYAAMTAIFAKVSGGQFNPVITVAAMLTSKTGVLDGICYIVAQVVGAICAGGLLAFMLPTSETIQASQWYAMVVNGYDQGAILYQSLNQLGLTFGIATAIVVEVVASIIVVAAAMQSMKSDGAPTRSHTMVMGLAYAAATAMAFPVTGAAINPIRATGIAIFAQGKGLGAEPLAQLWVFWVSAILAAAIVALVIIVAQLLSSNKSPERKAADADPAEAEMLEQEDMALDADDTDIEEDVEVRGTVSASPEAAGSPSADEHEDGSVKEQ